MSTPWQLRRLQLGTGMPKICIPLVGRSRDALLAEIATVKTMQPDMIEWRADFFSPIQELPGMLRLLREQLGDLPIIFTLRTKRENGAFDGEDTLYQHLIISAAESGLVDLVDIELFTHAQTLRSILDVFRNQPIKVLMSNHDFISTPSKREILRRLRQMESLGADLCKIAVMPNSAEDVLTLLDATQEAAKTSTKLLVTMAMGKMGMISRIAGEVFSSCITFGSGAEASAPGQISALELRGILDMFKL